MCHCALFAHLIQGVRDRLSDSIQTLEIKLSEKEACCEELEKMRYEEEQNCQLMEVLMHAFQCSKLNCVILVHVVVHIEYISYIYVVYFA